MENQQFREQPETNLQVGEADNTNVEAKLNEGSLGKFKDAESLLSAYNSLQAEFTRKSQRLSELEKQAAEQNDAVQQACKTANTPLYERENWSEIVADFLSSNEDAKPYSKEICNEIMEHKEEYLEEKSLEKAYAKVLRRHFVKPEEIANNGEFIQNYVLNSDEIKNKVMELYLKELSENKPPRVISSSFGGQTLTSKQPLPKNLEEAKAFVKQMIEN